MIYVLAFLAGVFIGYVVEAILDMITDECED
jgi:hypothetical protein